MIIAIDNLYLLRHLKLQILISEKLMNEFNSLNNIT